MDHVEVVREVLNSRRYQVIHTAEWTKKIRTADHKIYDKAVMLFVI